MGCRNRRLAAGLISDELRLVLTKSMRESLCVTCRAPPEKVGVVVHLSNVCDGFWGLSRIKGLTALCADCAMSPRCYAPPLRRRPTGLRKECVWVPPETLHMCNTNA